MALGFPRVKHLHVSAFFFVVTIAATGVLTYLLYANSHYLSNLRQSNAALVTKKDEQFEVATHELEIVQKELEDLKNQDQVKRNDELQATIKNIENTYDKAVKVYEDILDLKAKVKDTKEIDTLFAKTLKALSDKDYTTAESTLTDLNKKIAEETAKIVTAAATIPVNIPVNNAPPGAGYSRQSVSSDAGTFMVSLVAADLGSTKVIVDTASESDCANNCPVLPLATFVSRSGAFAGVNGSYFCPASYPTCAGKTNSFDLLVMNKNKVYFNSGNNVYSNNPLVVFQSGSMRFLGSGSGWGRDTGVDGVLMNYPLLVSGGNVAFGGDDDPKKGSKGNRSFVANKISTGYIGVVHNATVAEAARVLKAMGMENALNLDDGGSTALWSGGYKVGPGRDLPNVILFVRK